MDAANAPVHRALLADRTASPVDRELLIAARLRGRDLVRRPQVELFVHEWALRTRLGDASVMSDQLHHVLRMSVHPTLSVRLVPAGQGIHAGSFGPFALLESPDYWPTLYREDHGGARLVDDAETVASYRSLIPKLRAAALDEHRSRDLLGKVAVELYDDGEDGGRTGCLPVIEGCAT